MTEGIDNRLANRILWGLLVGAIAGGVTLLAGGIFPDLLPAVRRFATLVLDPLGQVFLRMLFFVVIPLVFASLAMGVAQLERLTQLGPLATRTFLLFFVNMSIAVALGMVMMNVLEPGSAMAPEARESLLQEYGGAAQQHIEKRAAQPDVTPMTVVEMFMPRNLFGAFVGNNRDTLGDVLPLILFAILVGAAAVGLPRDRRDQLRSGLGLINDLMTRIVHFALCDRPVRRAGDDLQRDRQDRLGHRHRARRVRARLHRRDDAAPVRHDVAVAAVPGQAQPARDLATAAPGAGDGVLDQLERRDAADRAHRRARGPRRARAGRGLRAAARHDHEHGRERRSTKAAWCCSSRRCSALTSGSGSS